MSLMHVFIESEDEQDSPPSQPVLKVSYFEGGHIRNDPNQGYLEPIVYFNVGDFEENYEATNFTNIERAQFAVNREDLVRALTALGVLSVPDLIF